MTRRLSQSLVLFGFIAALACSASPPPTGIESAGRTANGGSGGTIPTGSGGADPAGSGGTIVIAGTSGMVDPNDMRDVPVRQPVCDANGVCTCLRVALLGTLESAADEKDTQPFVDWLNERSAGATVTMVSTKPTLDATFLANYDILIVANVNGWSFAASETAAVETWVRQTGGGIIALTGFVSTDAEPAATSQLIQFAGYRYQPPLTAQDGQELPVYYQGGTTDLKRCLAWSGDVDGTTDAIITAPIKFVPQTGSLEKLTFALDYVGAFIGWAISPPAGATTVATDPVTGQIMASALEFEGKGRIFVFGDEWVIFKNQWEPAGSPHNAQMDMYNPCWITATSSYHSVQTLYQTKQFWYDAINWAAPPNQCGFVVNDPDVVVK